MLKKRTVKKTLQGYARASKWIETERRARLTRLSEQEAWAMFDDLYRTWEQLGKNAGGDWQALEERRIAEKVALRRTLDRFARKRARRQKKK